MDRLLSYLRLAGAILLCVLTFIAASAATAQSITNIASVTWQQGGQTMTAASNLVTITKVAARASITTYTGAAGGSTSLTFTPSTCIRASPSSSSNGAAEAKTTANVLQSSSIAVGGMLYFTVNAPQQNLDPNAADSIQVLLTTSSNDKETVTAYESGPNTGLFIGAVPTVPAPPAPIQGNCALSVAVGDTVTIAALPAGAAAPVATAQMSVTQDPFGYVFDSASGNAVNGTSVTLINAATGTPAQVLAADGVSSWPSTIVTGQSVTDGAGTSFTLNAGQYLFPVVAAGQYRLVVAPPPPYSAPSVATSEDLAGIVRPGGTPVEISQASYGNIFSVGAGGAVRVDVPVDRPAMRLTLSKSASRASAQAGNVIFYTVALGNPDPGARRNVVVVDKPASQLRIRPDSVRLDGAPAGPAVSFSADGHIMTVKLSSIAGSSNHILTYAAVVRTDSVPGAAPNNVAVTDSRGLSSTAAAVVRIVADQLTDRMTLVGRVTGGGCSRDGAREGIANVRLMLEDGSFAITDEDGRYHFDGLVPGDHVVAAAPMTLPPGGHFENCSRSTRNAGSASSRFVSGQGGSLLVADFYAVLPPPELAKAEQRKTGPSALRSDASSPGAAPLTSPAVLSDKAVAGADTDWLAFGDGPDGFLFPGTDQNPRSPAIRVVIRHRDGQKIELSANGKPVQTVAFDGVKHSSNHSFAVSLWSGVPLDGERTQLSATVRNRDGSTARTFTRDVYFSNVAASATLVPEQTHLVADGRRRPVIALRILDRNGRPVHRGLAGDLTISEPYESADVDTAMQQRSLSRLGRDTPHWAVTGDDGIAYVELMPTMVSGAIHLGFTFDDNGQKRQRTIDSWVVPGNIPWTLVGIAEGSVGARSIAHVMQRSGKFDSDLGSHARAAFYVKGRVLGKYLLTLAYDSTKQSADQPLAGSIDPKAYYTVYADGSSRRFDAASRSKLYVRIEARSFYGLFGDFQTGFSQTQLAHYDRVLTGVAGEATLGGVHVKAFGAKTATIERHLEIQGGGVSGPYSLGTNAIVENSETVTLQVRDRYRSNQIISSTVLTRFIDYDVDLLSGTIMFKQPVLSHDSNLDPQFIIVDFDVEPELAAADRMVGGGRADWTSPNHQLRVGATFLSTVGANAISRRARTNLVALDLKADPNSHTEIRAEVAVSRTNGVTSRAWQVEAETHTRSLDLLAYVHSTDADYGVGNTGNAELGWRKYGLDGKLRLTDHFAILSSLWDDQSLTSTTNRRALQVKAEYHFDRTDFHVGLSAFEDHVANALGVDPGSTTSVGSTVVEIGASRKFFGDRLQIDAAASVPIGKENSIDLAPTDTISARYQFNSKVRLVATYEIAKTNMLDTHTLRAGFEVQAWRGAKLSGSAGEQQVVEYGERKFAAFGLSQSLEVNRHLMIDGSIDMNKVLSGFDASRIVNVAQPVVNGGQLDGGGPLTENFTALTLGAGWKYNLWSATLRGEYRRGEFAQRQGLTGGLIRQLGEGSVLGSGLTLTRASGTDGSRSAVLDSSIAFADRPASSDFALLSKVEFRSDQVVATTGQSGTVPSLLPSALSARTITAVAGTAGDTGLTLNRNAHSRRFIASLSIDWSPRGRAREDTFIQRSEVSLFLAARHNLDAYDGYNLAGSTLLAGLDGHLGIGDRFEFGCSATVRASLSGRNANFAFGPSIGFVPRENVLVRVGYNIAGFRDADFSANRSTTRGVFASMRMKLDDSTLGFLGLDGRPR